MSVGKRKVAGNDWQMARPSQAGMTWNDIEQILRVHLEYHRIRAVQHDFQKSWEKNMQVIAPMDQQFTMISLSGQRIRMSWCAGCARYYSKILEYYIDILDRYDILYNIHVEDYFFGANNPAPCLWTFCLDLLQVEQGLQLCSH